MSASQSQSQSPPSLPHTTSQPAPALFSLTSRTALVTGASRGIGAACAIALAEAGASIILAHRPQSSNHEPTLQKIERAIQDRKASGSGTGGEDQVVKTVECDIGNMDSVKGLFPKALEVAPKGEIDILVNCAGIQRRNPALEFKEEDWDEVLNTNLKSIFILSQAAGRHMVPRRQGSIINFCSLMTFQGGLTIPAYAAAKGGLGQLTKALANEWSAHGVRVNGICPGYVETDMNAALLQSPTRLPAISARIPAGRWGTPEDFKGVVVLLASEASMYMCGELVVVDGGWMGR